MRKGQAGLVGLTRSRMVGALLALVVATVCVRLGVWQLDRHSQRKTRNAFVAARLVQDPVIFSGGDSADSLEFRRTLVVGVFDRSRELIEWGRVVNGVPSVYVATPLVTPEGYAVLVERGWAASPSARAVDLAQLTERDSTVVEGVLLRLDGGSAPSDTTWPLYVRRADPSVLRSHFPYPLAPLVLRRTALPENPPRGLGIVPLPQLTAGPHLSYAIQWFAFAVIAVVGPLMVSGVFRKPSSVSTKGP